MAVRLTCLTEAGGRGAWTAAAEINILGRTQTAANKAAIGEWGPLIGFPLVPAAAAALPNNKARRLSRLHASRAAVSSLCVVKAFKPALMADRLTEQRVSSFVAPV